MIIKTKAIVLHQVKYAETSLIINLYTEAAGKQSYIINGVRSSKSKTKTAFFQPLFLLEIDAYHHPNKEIHRLKEYRILEAYQSIPFQVSKSAVALFLSEILNKTLRSEEPDTPLFDFLHHSLIFFDTEREGHANFHLWFLLQLAGYLGFKPSNQYGEKTPWFNLKTGQYVAQKPAQPVTPSHWQSQQIAELLKLQAHQLNQFKTDGENRSALLTLIVEYYAIHFEGMGQIKSLEVLKEVFK